MWDYDEPVYESEPDISDYQDLEDYEEALARHEFRCDEGFCYDSSNYIGNDKNDDDLDDDDLDDDDLDDDDLDDDDLDDGGDNELNKVNEDDEKWMEKYLDDNYEDDSKDDDYYFPFFDFDDDEDDYMLYLMDSYFRTTIFGGPINVRNFGSIPKLGYITQSTYTRKKLDEYYIVEDAYWLHKVCGYDVASYGYSDDLDLKPFD